MAFHHSYLVSNNNNNNNNCLTGPRQDKAMADSRLFRSLSLLVAALAIAWTFYSLDVSPFKWLPSITYKDAGSDMLRPQIYTLSEDPVVVYVKDFISTQEAAHLVQLA